jgi:hypothetical protein
MLSYANSGIVPEVTFAASKSFSNHQSSYYATLYSPDTKTAVTPPALQIKKDRR